MGVLAASADTLNKVQSIIAEQLGTDTGAVGADKKFADLGAVSLDTVEIMMALGAVRHLHRRGGRREDYHCAGGGGHDRGHEVRRCDGSLWCIAHTYPEIIVTSAP